MNQHRTITGYCQTQKRNYSVVLTCIDNGEKGYLKGRVDCDYVRHGGNCNDCSVRNDYPDQFR